MEELPGSPMYDESLKIDGRSDGTEIVKKLQDIVLVFLIHGLWFSAWSEVLFLCLSPELKYRVRI
ncbi:hypothetical protein DASC09_036230 [Saccharomycopsis crataegensis]|uniref:Uncharacterized protein n=1 Tax=Saccharomycopsis crataegensis TaxID=43959 RepID=A0AAV5QQ59_9ASCO|nr:hypothetical protein DASC09_036230 [Saccharomycopsis crataegensis]